MATLIERLADHASRFDFFQAITLLEEHFAIRGISNPLDTGHLHLQSDISLAFPPGDIAGAGGDDDAVEMRLSFMGLTGATSPLPIYFSESVSREATASRALQDFLALFNHRMYVLFFRAWKKYRLLRRCCAPSDMTERIARLAGVQPETSPEKRMRLAAFCGLHTMRNRSGAGLCALLSEFFGIESVSIVNWVPQWVPIRDIKRLGGARLGVDALAGTTMLDRAGKFRIVLGPLRRDVFEHYLPGSAAIAEMQEMVRAYCADPLSFDIEVKLQSIELVPVVLGAQNAPLGRTSALGKSDEKTDMQSVVIC